MQFRYALHKVIVLLFKLFYLHLEHSDVAANLAGALEVRHVVVRCVFFGFEERERIPMKLGFKPDGIGLRTHGVWIDRARLLLTH